jgi:hypothetical protein
VLAAMVMANSIFHQRDEYDALLLHYAARHSWRARRF